MTHDDTLRMLQDYYNTQNPSADEEFRYTEALGQLIAETGQPKYMAELAWYYCEHKRFDLELKYLEMAAACGYGPAYEELGYMWYYGQHGEKDYKKAFECYTKGSEPDRYGNEGSLWCKYKLADMYRFGCAVQKDESRYCSMIEEAYEKVKNPNYLNEPFPEIAYRLAGIRAEQSRTEEAVKLLKDAKNFMAERLSYEPFWGHVEVMGRIVRLLYQLSEFDTFAADFYDLFYLTENPGIYVLTMRGKKVELQAVESEAGSEEELSICYRGNWYRNFAEFCKRADLDGEKFTSIYDEFYKIESVAQNASAH